jgi:hypothetical protein
MPIWWLLIRPPNCDPSPNGLGNGLMVKSQMNPARLLMMAKSADEDDDVAEHRRVSERPDDQTLDGDAAGEGNHHRVSGITSQ